MSPPIYFAHTTHPVDPTTHEPVIDHTVAVSTHCLANTPSDTTLTDGTPTRPVLYVMAWCHDIGKLTTWWQEDHHNSTVPSVDRPPGKVGTHSHLGGVATWWVLREMGYSVRTALPAAIAVSRHHGSLPKLESYTLDRFADTSRWETVRHQIKNIDNHDRSREIATQMFAHLSRGDGVAVTEPSDADPPDISWQRFVEAVEDGLRGRMKSSVTGLTGVSLNREHKSAAVYHDLLELWGGLKGADTPASAGLRPADQALPTPDVIDTYVQSELSPPTDPETPVELLNAKRESIRQDTLTHVDRLLGNHPDQQHELTVDADTGGGKQTDSVADTPSVGDNYRLDSFVSDAPTESTQPDGTTPQSGSDTPKELSAGVYTLTLPTGAGKTITGTQAALKFHHALDSDGPLIHILPYTSIIEQTEGVYNELFDPTRQATDAVQPTIGVDHYLADVSDASSENAGEADETTPDDDGDERIVDGKDEDNLTETAYNAWHSDITLSTTVQLWESLYGPTKSQATKLPQFYNSTVIIDEPQSTPPTWWSRVEHLIGLLNTVFDATVILMSATHPPLEYPTTTDTPDDAELGPSVTLPDNVTVSLDQSVLTETPIQPPSAAQLLHDELKAGRDSILSIHNTISNARSVTESLIGELAADPELDYVNIHTLYNSLIEGTSTNGDADVNAGPGDTTVEAVDDRDLTRETIYDQIPTTDEVIDALRARDADIVLVPLTTRHRPCDRSRILDTLTELLEQYPRSEAEQDDLPTIVAVTTQLVEAGVDISFEALFRDIAPYDSLVQAAGRCNRNYEYGIGNGRVTVWQLDSADPDPSSRLPAEYVYNASGINELNLTTETLCQFVTSNSRQLSQEDFLNGYSEYRSQVIPQVPDQTPHIESVDGETMTRESLIDDDRPEITVCVSQTPIEDEFITAYRKADRINHTGRKVALRNALRHIACDIPRNRDENPITEVAHEIDDDFYILDRSVAEATDHYGWKGVVNESTDSVSHRFM